MIRRFLNGETHLSKPQVSIRQFITYGREPGELKHLSTRRKERNIDFLSSGERKGRSLNCGACTAGLRTAISYTQSYQNGIGKAGQRG